MANSNQVASTSTQNIVPVQAAFNTAGVYTIQIVRAEGALPVTAV